jgi:DNA adenine methylase
VARYRSRIKLYQQDALKFSNQLVRLLGPKGFVFYDPPYIDKGAGLYLNDYNLAGHQRLAERVSRLRLP